MPAIDPSGQRLFSGQTTSVACPTKSDLLPTPAFPNAPVPPKCPTGGVPLCGAGHGGIQPAAQLRDKSYVVIMPGRVVAPVGSEVIVVSGICGDKGHYVKRQPLEWMMSPDSVGHVMEVSSDKWCFLTDWLHTSDAEKLDLDWAKNRTHVHRQTVTRGTPALNDDVVVAKGQSWVSVMSPSEGASYVTVMAPKEENWDLRRQTATIYWVDAQWTLPPPQISRVDRREPAILSTTLTRAQGLGPIEGWLVRYEVLDGPAAMFENSQRTIEVPTDINGQANVRLLPQSGESGITQVAVQIVRPAGAKGDVPRMVVGQGLTSVQWTAPGLAIRTNGPPTAEAEKPVTYRVEVSNTGDLPAPNVVLAYAIPEGAVVTGSNPPAQQFGNRLEWRLGDLPARGTPVAVEVTLAMRLHARYDHRFRATSVRGGGEADLVAEGAASTIVNVSALTVRMTGPQTAPIGSQATFLVEIQNTSSVPATNVMITDTFDAGLEHVTGQVSPLTASFGRIEPGQTEAFALNFVVKAPGQHCHRVDVTADGGLRSTAQGCVTASGEIPTPRMAVRLLGPESLQVGEEGLYKVEVRNNGTVPLTNLRIGLQHSASVVPTGATDGKELSRGEVAWRRPELRVGEAIVWELQARALRGDPSARNLATVTSQEGVTQSAELITQITGGAAPIPTVPDPVRPDPVRPNPVRPDPGNVPPEGDLIVTVNESEDPVVVGRELTYRILVKNNSREADRQLGMVITLPEGLEFVSVSTPSDIDRTRIVPTTIAEVRGKEELRPIDVKFRATKPGNYTLKVLVRSLRVPEGITATQETRVVAE